MSNDSLAFGLEQFQTYGRIAVNSMFLPHLLYLFIVTSILYIYMFTPLYIYLYFMCIFYACVKLIDLFLISLAHLMIMFHT